MIHQLLSPFYSISYEYAPTAYKGKPIYPKIVRIMGYFGFFYKKVA